LDPEVCLLPWPSSAFLVADASTRTGFRVSIPAASMPISDRGKRVDPTEWNSWDGFSPMTTLIAEFTAVIDPAPLASWHDPGASLAADSPTVLVDVDSGERIAHFAEIEGSPDVAAGHTTLYIRPAARLAEKHHYAVGIRNLHTMDGGPLLAPAAFAALRDGGASAIDADGYERDVFGPLVKAGVARASLLLAWDFRTASGETAWGDVVAMRDDAFAMAGAGGLGCSVTSSAEDPSDPVILRRVDGEITVPAFLDASGRIARDAAGHPKIVGTIEAPFIALIPRDVGTTAPIWIYGHGLYSDRTELLRDFARDVASQGKAVIAATNFTGFTRLEASRTLDAFLDPSTFPNISDPLRQSVINTLLLPRTLAGACAAQAALQVGGVAIIDGSRLGYFGNSFGGTLGTSLAALSPDIPRFALGVAGMDFPVQMPRNYDWPEIQPLFEVFWPNRIDRDLLVVMSAHYFDHFDSALAPHALGDPLPGSGTPRILMQIGLYDTDVPNISSELAARTLGLPELSPTSDPVWGLAASAAPKENALVVYGTGAAPITDATIPSKENGVHEAVRLDPRAQQQLTTFLLGGGVVDACGGACVPTP
jgi:hypothetical protein